tara:strand:+ start:141 stop:299 length:159 start_codon:yes stop_codon:yes gene_type:complete
LPRKGRSRLDVSVKKTTTRGIMEATEKASKREEKTDKTSNTRKLKRLPLKKV